MLYLINNYEINEIVYEVHQKEIGRQNDSLIHNTCYHQFRVEKT